MTTNTKNTTHTTTDVPAETPAPQAGRVFGLPPEEQWQEWRRVYGVRFPAMRVSQVPEILRSIDEFKELAAVRQRLIDSDERCRAESNAIAVRNDARQMAYRDALRRATLEGTEFPNRPVLEQWQGLEFTHDLFDEYHAILESVERGILRTRADEWKAYVRDQGRKYYKQRSVANQALAEALEAIKPFDEAQQELQAIVDSGAGRVYGAPVETEARVIPQRQRASEDAAVQQILEDFAESRRPSPRSRRTGLR